MNNLFKKKDQTTENVLLQSILIRAVEKSHFLQPLSSPSDRFSFFLITFQTISFKINNGSAYRVSHSVLRILNIIVIEINMYYIVTITNLKLKINL